MTQSEPALLVSVILVCCNSRNWLPRCLESLRSQTLFPRTEIIVVGNASADGSETSARQMRQGWPNVSIIQTGSNLEFSASDGGAL
jgi:GT2 family glycosyltransferase